MTKPPTEQQLDEIETRAAHLHEYALLDDEPMQADADQLTGKDVPALVDTVRRLAAALTEMTHCRDNALRALYRDDVETDIDLEETIAAPFYGPGWNWDESDLKPVVREAADAVRPAFGKLTQERDRLRSELAAEAGQAEVTLDRVQRIASRLAAHAVGFGDVLDESARGPWGRTVGADIAELTAAVAPDAASVPPGAPLCPSQPSSVSESAQSPTGAPTGPPSASLPAEDFTGTQPCGHDDYHSPHPWADRPSVWCPGIGYDDDQAAAEETHIVADDSSDPEHVDDCPGCTTPAR